MSIVNPNSNSTQDQDFCKQDPNSPLFRAHNTRVQHTSSQVASFHRQGVSFRIYHGSTNSTRPSDFTSNAIVDTSTFSNVVHIATTRNVALVEPNVPMSALVDATLKHGLLPPVVPEFPNITVGGAFNGTGGESSSFRHGFFDRTVNWVEIILADGTVERVSAHDEDERRRELFHAAAGSFGTLGVTTLFDIQLESLKGSHVALSYWPVSNAEEAVKRIREEVNDSIVTEASGKLDPHHFVDGILFSQNRGVVMTGRIVSDTESRELRREHKIKVRRFHYMWNRWFYLHAEDAIRRNPRPAKSHASAVELVPIKDYLFRYDISAFWMGKETFPLWHVPFNRLSQAIAYPLVHTKTLYSAMHLSGALRKFIIQDLIMPVPSTEAASKDADPTTALLQYISHNLSIYPLWLCPILGNSSAPMHQHSPLLPAADEPSLLINIGTWGAPHAPNIPGNRFPRASHRGYNPSSQSSMDQWLRDNRALEAEVQRLGGKKWLYAQTFYGDESQFYEGIGVDQKWYEDVRKQFGAEGLPSLWDKLGWKGLGETTKLRKRKGLRAFVGAEYLLKGR